MNDSTKKAQKDDDLNFQAALRVTHILNQHGYDAYLIGGAVRDLMLGVLPKDYDLVTNAKPDEILQLPEISKSRYKDTAQAFGVTRVFIPVHTKYGTAESEIEIATFRRDIEAHLGRKATKIEFATLEDDVMRRDFTVNALAYDPQTSQVIDFVDGIDDLYGKKLRFIGNPDDRIQEDPLRVLRGIRLRNQLGFEYEHQTLKAIKSAIAADVLEKVAVDRLRDELSLMLIDKNRRQAIEDLDKLGALEKLLPEITAMKDVAQPPELHSEGSVWEHTLLAISVLPPHPSSRLAWATLLHDVGKPPTIKFPTKDGERIRFNSHSEVGAKMARQILNRFNFSKRQIADITWMVEYHLGIDDLPKMRPGHRRYIMSHPAFADLLELHRADATAAWSLLPSGKIDKSPPDLSRLEQLWHDFQQEQANQTAEPSLKRDLDIDGRWLMANYQLEPNKQLGWVLDRLRHAYLDGAITSESDARNFINKLLKK